MGKLHNYPDVIVFENGSIFKTFSVLSNQKFPRFEEDFRKAGFKVIKVMKVIIVFVTDYCGR